MNMDTTESLGKMNDYGLLIIIANKKTSQKPIPEHRIRMLNGGAYTFDYDEYW